MNEWKKKKINPLMSGKNPLWTRQMNTHVQSGSWRARGVSGNYRDQQCMPDPDAFPTPILLRLPTK